MRFLDTSNWSDHIVDHVITTADKLDTLYRGHHIVSVGQSPAWITHTIGELRKARGEEPHISYVAFSGCFVHKKDNAEGPQTAIYETNPDLYPSATALRDYYNYLSGQQETPRDVLKRFDKGRGRKTVFLDFIQMGLGLASFMHIWFAAHHCAQSPLVKASLNQALDIHILRNGRVLFQKDYMHVRRSDNHQDGMTFALNYADFTNVSTNGYIAGMSGEEEGHAGSDRLVPSFDISAKGKAKLLPTHNEARQAALKRRLAERLRTYEARNTVERRRAPQKGYTVS